MKFKCNRNSILQEITIAQDVISNRNALSILSNVLIEGDNSTLIIRATDSKVRFETKLPVEIIIPGTTTVFCEKLLGILRSLPDEEILFTMENSRLHISPEIEKVNFQLKIIASDQYPEFNEVGQENFFEVPQKDFTDMISQTVLSVSDDETRYFMNGVFLEKVEDSLVMAATDGRRLSYIKKEIKGEIKNFSGVIIPTKVLHLIKKISSGEGNLSLAVSDKNIFFHLDNQKISSNLIEGKFPNYQRVIPESQEYEILVDKEEFFKALTRVSLLVENKSRRIYLAFAQNSLTFRSEETDIGVAKEKISCSYEGPENEISLNCNYLGDPLKVISSKDISILYTDPKKVITILSHPKQDYFHIIMPIRFD